MEHAIRSPSEINSFDLNESIFDLNKKRKLQADQFGLPLPKHKCWNHRVSTKPLDILEENQLVEDDLSSRLTEEPTIEDGSEPEESAEDSNSFMEDYDCVSSDAKFETDVSKPWSSTATSTTADWSCNNVKDNQCSSDVTTAGASAENEPVYEAEEYDPSNYFDEIQGHQNIDDCIVEVDGEYIFRHEIGSIEPFKSFNKTLYSKKAKPDTPLLSSGSCSVNQGESGLPCELSGCCNCKKTNH
ncbi:uncharacterized protein [Euphorbia lathyris]|uniref:uncharacterized protein isoform X2 n=1 Tax=Euphorbia lathyris TaxID=212925 RepID=UPI0033136E87